MKTAGACPAVVEGRDPGRNNVLLLILIMIVILCADRVFRKIRSRKGEELRPQS